MYSPTILKIPSLLFVCTAAAALIGVVEHLLHKLPHAERTTPFGRYILSPRAVAATNTTTTSSSYAVITTTATSTAYVGVGTSTETVLTTNIAVGTSISPGFATPSTRYISVGTSTIPGTTLATIAPTAYVITGQLLYESIIAASDYI
jgi:hypothetical protein